MKKTRSLKRTQTVFHLLPHAASLFSARFSRGGFFFFQIPTQNSKNSRLLIRFLWQDCVEIGYGQFPLCNIIIVIIKKITIGEITNGKKNKYSLNISFFNLKNEIIINIIDTALNTIINGIKNTKAKRFGPQLGKSIGYFDNIIATTLTISKNILIPNNIYFFISGQLKPTDF
jgi:hypothetical protein